MLPPSALCPCSPPAGALARVASASVACNPRLTVDAPLPPSAPSACRKHPHGRKAVTLKP